MRKAAVFLTLLLMLSACNLPRRGLPAFSLTGEPAQEGTPTPTPTVPYEQCGWVWATQSLPELSAEVQAALEAAGLENITARAEAYGENCLSPGNEVLRFAAMQTDFHITVEVETLADAERMGALLETILSVLDNFPTESTPGPNPGYVGVTFTAGTEELNLWFAVTDGESARALGLRGAALLEELQNK